MNLISAFSVGRLARRRVASRGSASPAIVAALIFAACSSGGAPASGSGAPLRTSAPVVTPGALTGAPSDEASSGPTLAAATGELCKTVTSDEIASILGIPVITVEGDSKGCTWTTDKYSAVNLRIEHQTATDLAAQKIAFKDARDVSGIGDRAVWVPGATVLYSVYKGKVWAVQLVLFGTSDDLKDLATATAIMQKAFSRI